MISFGVFWHHHNAVIKAVDNLFGVCALFFFKLYVNLYLSKCFLN